MKTLLVVVTIVLAAGCSSHPSEERPVSTLTEHQRDSVLAHSSLPGADVAGRAMAQSASETRRAAMMDSLPH